MVCGLSPLGGRSSSRETSEPSFRYQEPVIDLILERMPISIYFGLVSSVIVYLVCIPLGIIKALRHRSHMDKRNIGRRVCGLRRSRVCSGCSVRCLLLYALGMVPERRLADGGLGIHGIFRAGRGPLPPHVSSARLLFARFPLHL